MDPNSLSLDQVCFMLGERDIVIFQQNAKIAELTAATSKAAELMSKGQTQVEELEAANKDLKERIAFLEGHAHG